MTIGAADTQAAVMTSTANANLVAGTVTNRRRAADDMEVIGNAVCMARGTMHHILHRTVAAKATGKNLALAGPARTTTIAKAYGNPGYGGPRYEGDYGRGMRGQGAGGSEYGRHFGDQARSGIAGRPAWGTGMAGGGNWSGSGMSGSMTGKGPKGYTRSDERIREQVCDCLTDDPHIDASAIEIQVKGGEVTMSGTVDSRNVKRHAEDLIEHLSGVKHVQNNLRVQDQTSA
jgi:BON domain